MDGDSNVLSLPLPKVGGHQNNGLASIRGQYSATPNVSQRSYGNIGKSLKLETGVADNQTREEVDAKIAAAEARTDTKFAEMIAELRLLNQKMEHVEKSTGGLGSTIWIAALTCLAISIGAILGVYQYGSAMFGTGMSVESAANASATVAATKLQPQLDDLARKSDDLAKSADANAELLKRMLAQFAIQGEQNPKIEKQP